MWKLGSCGGPHIVSILMIDTTCLYVPPVFTFYAVRSSVRSDFGDTPVRATSVHSTEHDNVAYFTIRAAKLVLFSVGLVSVCRFVGLFVIVVTLEPFEISS